MVKQDSQAAYGKIIARAWRDPAFKMQLMADPRATLEHAGVAVPAGVTVEVMEDSATHVHFVLPLKPTTELSDEVLDEAAGGACFRGQSVYLHCGKDDKVL